MSTSGALRINGEPQVDLRRGYPRTRVTLPALWNGHTAKTETGRIHDLSVAGLFLEPTSFSARALRPGSWIRIMVVVPDWHVPLQVRAQVHWVGRKHAIEGVGVEFDTVQPELERYFNAGRL